MKLGRRAAIYGISALAVLIVGLVLVLSLRFGPNASGPPSLAGRSAPSSVATNHTTSNANALGGTQSGSSDAKNYPTLTSDKPLVETINGYTVTLYPLYATANRIALKYTIQSAYDDLSKIADCQTLYGQDPPCMASEPAIAPATPLPLPTREAYEPQLTSSDGRVLPWAQDASYQPLENAIGSMLIFDADLPPENLPVKLNLHLVMNEAQFLISIPGPTGFEAIREIKGPFSFDFSVPVDPLRRIADVNQTATTPQGDTITIARVIATTHDVRVSWRVTRSVQAQDTPGSGSDEFGPHACCSLKLEVGSKSTAFQRAIGSPSGHDDVVDLATMGEQGEWTISTSYFSTWEGNAFYPDIPGPVFHFSVPPAINSLQP